MQGDLLGIPGLAFGNPRSTGGRVEGVIVPSIRGFKIGEDQSPRPEDRVYFGFNYYDEVNKAVNRRLGDVVSGVQITARRSAWKRPCWTRMHPSACGCP
jgi:hypothetical protein